MFGKQLPLWDSEIFITASNKRSSYIAIIGLAKKTRQMSFIRAMAQESKDLQYQ